MTLVLVKNPFDPHGSRDIRPADWQPCRPLADYLADVVPFAEGLDFAVSINGRLVAAEEQAAVIPAPGDYVVFCAVVHGGGGGGKNPLQTIAMIAVVAVAAWAGLALAFSNTSVAAFAGTGISLNTVAGVATGVFMGMGGMLVNAVFPTQMPELPRVGQADFVGSNTYGWEAAANRVEEGRAIPVLYGVHQVAPQIIANHVTVVDDNQYLNLLMAVAEGPLDAIYGVRINDTAIENYKGVEWGVRLGTNSQEPAPNFSDTIDEKLIGAKLSTDWTTVQADGNALTGLAIGLSWPRGLYHINSSNGNRESLSVTVAIDYRKVGDATWLPFPINRQIGWSLGFTMADQGQAISVPSTVTVQKIVVAEYYTLDNWFPPPQREYYLGQHFTISGGLLSWLAGAPPAPEGTLATIYGFYYESGQTTIDAAKTAAVRRIFRIDGLAPGQYEARVCLVSAPASGPYDISDTYFEFLQEIVADDFAYPNVALLWVRALATDQLSGGMPRVTCMAARNTVSVVDGSGTTIAKPATNRAWICYDMLTNGRYGGQVATSRMVYADFAAWADHCTAEGLDCHLYLDTAAPMSQMLATVASGGRGTVVQQGTRFGCLVDKPSTPVQLFTVGNIVAGSFEETFLPIADRANVIEITYFDAALDYSRQVVEVRAADFDTTAGEVNKSQVTLYGCINRTQAIKHGKFLLACNRHLTRTVALEADVDAIACLPGDLILVQHDVPQWGYGGRVESASANSLGIDREITMQPGIEYRVVVRHQDDDAIEERTVASVAQETTTDLLVLSGAWSKVPAAGAVYTFGEVDKTAKKYRVASIARTADMQAKITATEYQEAVYAGIGSVAEIEQETDLVPVKNLLAIEGTRTVNNRFVPVISLSWRGVAVAWNIFLRETGGAWRNVGYSATPEFIVEPVEEGRTYEVAVATGDRPETGETAAITIVGLTAPPANVTGFGAMQNGNDIVMRWNAVADADLAGYEIREGASWTKGTTVAVKDATQTTASWQPPMPGTYRFWIKAFDQCIPPVYSTTAAPATITATTVATLNIVDQGDDVALAAPGTTTGMCYIPTPTPVIALISGLTDTDLPASWTDTTNADLGSYAGTADMTGSYESLTLDLGRVADCTIRVACAYDSAMPAGVTDLALASRTDLDFPLDTDLDITSNGRCDIFSRWSDDNLTWTAYQQVTGPVSIHARYWQWQAVCTVDTIGASFNYQELPWIVDVSEIDHAIYGQAISASGTTITLASLGLAFFLDYQVKPAALGTAALYPVVEKAASQFTVRLFDASGVGVAGTVDLNIRGF